MPTLRKLAVLFALLLFTPVPAQGGAPPGIHVTAVGAAHGEPDVATADLGVNVRREQLDEALSEANETMTRILDALRARGVEERDIRTVSFSVHRDERTDREGEVISVHYRVGNIVRVTMRDFEVVGGVLSAAVDAGANTVRNIGFAISDTAALRREARERAVQEARDKAAQLAQLAGVALGPVERISEHVHEPSPVAAAPRTMALEALDAVPIEGGELEVVVAVEIVFAIDQPSGP